MTKNILDMVRKVAELRAGMAEAVARKRDLLAAWEVEHSQLLEHLAKTMLELTDAETTLRAEAIKIYQETGNKTPGPGLGIRLSVRLDYEEAEALSWAMEHKMALRLDVKAFEKITKASPLLFVRVSGEAQATIAQDLETVLKDVKEA